MSSQQAMPVARQGRSSIPTLEPTLVRASGPGRRRVLVTSVDQLGTGPSKLALVVSLRRTARQNSLLVSIEPPDGVLRERSHAMLEMVRSLCRGRLVNPAHR